jgi:hypothetical protein
MRAAMAHETEGRFETAVICGRDDVFEFDVATGGTRFPERDQPVELVGHDPERLWPVGCRPSRGDMVSDAKRRWVGSIRLCGGSRAHEGAQPDAIQRLSTQRSHSHDRAIQPAHAKQLCIRGRGTTLVVAALLFPSAPGQSDRCERDRAERSSGHPGDDVIRPFALLPIPALSAEATRLANDQRRLAGVSFLDGYRVELIER